MVAGLSSRVRRRVPAVVIALAVLWAVGLALLEPAAAAGGGPGDGDPIGPLAPTTNLQVTPLTVPPATLPPVTLPPVPVEPSIAVPPVPLPDLQSLVPGPAPAGVSEGQTAAAPDAAPTPTDVASAPAASDAPAVAKAPPSSPHPVAPVVRTPPAPATVPSVTGPLPLRLRNAALQTARRLSVPMGLAAAIVVFLVLQPRLDRNDPNVAHAGVSRDDDLLGFQ